jgi:hypothetical protein
VVVIGRSENVLTETVTLLRAGGLRAGATNDFDSVLALFEPRSLNAVVFGGMVPPDTKEALRTQLRTANPEIDFVQGLAGIPGLIAAQIEAALAPAREGAASVTYTAGERTLRISLGSPQAVRVTGFWATILVPPEPESTSEVIFDEVLRAGIHTMPLPASFPSVASFIVVRVGIDTHVSTVGPMPRLELLAPPA